MPYELTSIASCSRRRFLAFTAGSAVIVTTGRRLRPFSVHAQERGAASPFLDAALVHEISAEFAQADFDAMIQTYVDSGDKDWIEATVTIDGTKYEEVGLRLKGNSSLMGLRGGGFTQMTGDDTQSASATPAATTNAPVERRQGMGNDLSADEPESLPWLIRLDKYVDDQQHHGLKDLVIRSNSTATSLNEAVALDLLAEAGLASQQAAATAFIVNASDPALRLAIELPNDEWMAAQFSDAGLLFKAESTGDWSYRGDDPESYADVFEIEAGKTDDAKADFAPLTAFLQFVNESEDADFSAKLPAMLDVESFSVYLAMMDLIQNFDDISGPGNNAYLYYDRDASVFTVVPWDMNLAFGGMGGNGGFRDDAGGALPGQPPTLQEGATPVAGMQPPAGNRPDQPNDGGFVVNGQDGRGGRNAFVERFKAVTEFAAVIESSTSTLRARLYDSGVAAGILARRAGVLESSAAALVDAATITEESAVIEAVFEQGA